MAEPRTTPAHADPSAAQPPGPHRASRARRALTGLLGALLLLGPLVATELYMHEQASWLRPVLRRFDVSMDMKLLFVAHRERCPDLVTLGTSLTDQGLPPRYLATHSLAGEAIEDPFDFGAAEVRATNILAQYRWLRQRGCTPQWLLVEVSPIVLNGAHGGPTHDPPLMSAGAQLSMPPGFTQLRGYSLAKQLELATFERLLIHRRRGEIADRALNQHEAEEWFVSERERERLAAERERKGKSRKLMSDDPKLELDGKMTGLRKSLNSGRWAREQRKRRGMYSRGIYEWRPNTTEIDALEQLARAATDDGVTLIFQAPPVTDLYHSEIAPKLGMRTDFDAACERIEALAAELPGVVFHNAHADTSYETADFADWVHLSKRGAKRYVEELCSAASVALAAEGGG